MRRIAPCLLLIVSTLLTGCSVATRPAATTGTTAAPASSASARGCLELVPAPLPDGPSVGVRVGDGSSCERLEVEIVVSGVRDVFAASFDAVFDEAVVRYEGISTAGSFLGGDGAELQALDRAEGGRVVIGVTRWKESTGLDSSGTDVLATLTFTRSGRRGETALRFDPASLLGSEMPPTAKTDVSWAGGTLRIGSR